MTQKIGISVEAVFNSTGVQQGVQKIDQAVNEANKSQLDPVAPGTQKQLDDVADAVQNVGEQVNKVNSKPINPVSPQAGKQLDELNKRFQQLLKVDAELRRRIKATGQEGKLFEDIDWGATHPDKVARAKKLNSINEYLGAGHGGNRQPNLPPNHPDQPKEHGTAAQMAANVAQSGLRAAGPVGGVAANALGTGMSAGAGAGLMGLMGGLVALGVGKVVSGVMENLDKAQDNEVAYDRLKRTLGDVNVSFNGLKSALTDGAKNVKLTFGEFTQLGSQFAKAGNLKDTDYTSLPDEVKVGVGMSRSFGLDPSQGVGLMGTMRGMGITGDVQESRKFALLIGETIGKSGAFAKADEVMQAIGGYAESQTRNSMSRANVDGYGGMYSSMVGSGIPGMDATSSAALLNRINASLSAGGAKGEASQFFTAMVGNKMGLDPLKTQVMREGGMFATNDLMFGKGTGKNDESAYYRYMGKEGPTGSATFFDKTRETLEQQYGGNSDDQKLLRAQAFANHTGVNMNQSMAMLSLKPNQMGEMQKYAGDISKLNAGGIGNLAKVVTGTDADRKSVADSLMRRSDVSNEDKVRLSSVMDKGTVEEQKQILATLVASRDQEMTTGRAIIDSKNALDNIKTEIASKLIPITLELRHGIMSIAGAKDDKSPREIMEGVLRAEGKDKLTSVERRYAAPVKTTQNELDAIKKKKQDVILESRKQYGELIDKPEEVKRMLAELAEKEAAATAAHNKAKEAYTKAMEKATQEIEDGINDNNLGLAPGTTSKRRVMIQEEAERRSSGGGTSKPLDTSSIDGKLEEAEKKNGLPAGVLKSVMAQETGGKQEYLNDPAKYHYGLNANGQRIAPHTGQVSTAFGPFGILESTGSRPGYGVAPLKDKSLDEQIRFSSEYLAARSKSAGSIEGGLAGYGEGASYSNSVMSRMRRTKQPTEAPKTSEMASVGKPPVAETSRTKSPETTATVGKPPVAAVATPKGAKPLTVPPPGKVDIQELPPIGTAPVAKDKVSSLVPAVGAAPVKVDVVELSPVASANIARESGKRLDVSEARSMPSGTPLPKGYEESRINERMEARFSADPIVVQHVNQRGEMIRPDQTIPTRVASNWNMKA